MNLTLKQKAVAIVDAAKSRIYESACLRLELIERAPVLLVGEAYALDMARFRFYLPPIDRQLTRLSVFDSTNSWYVNGLAGLTGSIFETVHLVDEIIRLINPPYAAAYGGSAGGYFALLAASKIPFARLLALSPQSWVDQRVIANLGLPPNSNISDGSLPDLSGIFAAAPPLTSDAACFFPRLNRSDVEHVQRISGYAGIKLFGLETADHNTRAFLSERGQLRDLFNVLVSPPGTPGISWTPRSTKPPLIGAVDGIVDGVRILGWAQAPEDPDTPVDLDVILDDVIEGTVVADRMRPDLLRSRIGNGRHGFEFRLMAPLSDRPHVIEVRRAGRGSRLGGLRKVPRLRDLDTNLPPALVRQDVACQKLLPGFYSSHTEGDALLEHKILSDARDATGCFSAVHATVPPGSQNAATIRATAAGAKIGLVWRQVSTTPTCITLIVDGEHIEVPLTADQVGDVGSEPEIWRGMSFHLIQRAFGPGIHSVDIVLRSTKAADATSKLCVCGIIVEKPNG